MTKQAKTKSLIKKIDKIDPNNITEFGIKIVMDEEKILKEQEYSLEDI